MTLQFRGFFDQFVLGFLWVRHLGVIVLVESGVSVGILFKIYIDFRNQYKLYAFGIKLCNRD